MKRQYEVPQNEPQREDDSFKLCFGTMLVFLTLMTLTCVCFWPRSTVQKKVSSSNTVYDSWSGLLGQKNKPTTSTAAEPISASNTEPTSIPTVLSSRRTIPSTDKTFSVKLATQVPEVSDVTREVTRTDISERELASSAQTVVHSVTESDETIPAVTESTKTEETIVPTFKSTSEVGSSTLLGNTVSNTLPDSSENTIPYSSSARDYLNEHSSTVIEGLKSKTYESSSTDAKTLVTEIPVSYSSTSTDDSKLISNSEEGLHIGTMITNTEECSSSDSLGSKIVPDHSTSTASSPSTVDISTINYDNPSFSWAEDANSEQKSTKSTVLNDTLEDFIVDVSTTGLSCLKCPEPVCPVCLVQTCPVTEPTASPVSSNTCKTRQCHVVASRLLSLVDVSVDPCEDFYSYACGGMLDSPVLLATLDVWSRVEDAVKKISSASPSPYQKLKNYYEGCVDYDKLITLEERKTQGQDVLESVGKFYDASTTPEEDLTELLIRLLKFGSGTLFSIGLDVDPSNSSQFQVVVSLPDRLSSRFLTDEEKRRSRCSVTTDDDDFPLNLTEAYEMHQNCMNNLSEVLDTTQKALEFFELFDNNSSQLIEDILVSLELDLLEPLKEFPPLNVAQKDIQSKNHKLFSKVQLEAEIPQIAWGYLFSTLFNVEFDNTTCVQVYFMDYIKNFFAQIQTKSSRSIHNSLLAVFAHDLYSDIVQTHDLVDRERYCLRVTASFLPIVTSNLYLMSFPPDVGQALRQQVLLLNQQLVSAMESRISAAAWLDEGSLNVLITKLRFMSVQLPEMFSESQLSDSLGKCELSDKHFFEDSLCLLQQVQSRIFDLYSVDPHAAEALWSHFSTLFSTKPVYIYGLNAFLIPHTVVAPVYDKEMPRHVVLAQLGNIVARGIAHNFDRTGIKFTASGNNMDQMLSEAVYSFYEDMVDSSNLQFSGMKSFREAGHVYTYLLDPELTLDERLSDITAANLSLSLLSESEVEDYHLPWVPFSPKQVYFLTLAQTFCSKKKISEVFTSLYEGTGLLPFDRVLNLVANSEQFAEVFRCPQGTNMNMDSELKTRPFPQFERAERYTDIS